MKSFGALYYAGRGWTLAALFAGLAYARLLSDREPAFPALILVALGIAYRLHAARFIQGHSNHLRLAAGPLSTQGPYAWGRHPLYYSNLLTSLGLVGFANCMAPWAAAAFLSLVLFHHVLLMGIEEAFLASRLGEGYARYRRSTRPWPAPPGKRPSPQEGGEGATAAESPGAPAQGLGEAWKRQAANLGRTAACVAILWVLAGLRA